MVDELRGEDEFDVTNVIWALALVMGFIFVVSISIYIIRERYGITCRCQFPISIAVAILASLGVIVGLLTYYFLSKSFSKQQQMIYGNLERTLDFLDAEERKIITCLIEKKGRCAQNNLGKLVGLDPVKLHRRLLALESRGLILKKKKGMTNSITLDEEIRSLFIR